jgi:hypothetical protein
MLDLVIEGKNLHDLTDGKAFEVGGLLAVGGANDGGLFHLVLLGIFGTMAEFLV